MYLIPTYKIKDKRLELINEFNTNYMVYILILQ